MMGGDAGNGRPDAVECARDALRIRVEKFFG
jgi:hypothetical protein